MGLWKRLFYNAVITGGAGTPLIQKVAQKVVNLERSVAHTGTERAGIWLGAAWKEVSSDIRALMGSSGSTHNSMQEGSKAAKESPPPRR